MSFGLTSSLLWKSSLTFFNIKEYSKDTLLSIRKGVINTIEPKPFSPDKWNELKRLNVVRKTKRGRRGGKRLRRRIHSIVTNRLPSQQFLGNESATKTINPHNLIRVKKCNSNTPSAKFAVWNGQSIRGRKKASAIIDLVMSEHLDILAITESWLTGDERDNRILSDLKNALPDYVMHHVPRPKRGGGVAVLLRRGFDIVINPSFLAKSFEQMDVTISSKSSSIRLYVIYRPYPSKVNKFTAKMFFDEFSAFVETCTSLAIPFVIAGDFNFHMDVLDDREAIIFRELLDSASFDQHVNKPTHRCGHTLDLVITRSSDSIISDLTIDDTLPSDHFAVICKLAVSRPPVTKHQFRFRKLRDIDINAFNNDIAASSLVTDPANDVESLSTQFDNVMSDLLHCHAPEVSRSVSLRPHAPWYDEALRKEKQERRRCERQFCKSGLEVHRQTYRDQCKKYSAKLEEAKSNYHKLQLKDCDQKQLFRQVDKMCSTGSNRTLPSHDSTEKLANDFAEFFLRIRSEKLEISLTTSLCNHPCLLNKTIPQLSVISARYLKRLSIVSS
ncbi:uncharacterized protein [Amphiura filiformis]|uniref:uncharacterized protein n=1 Tax=Amphiura filiformis TaxID=82378 RepID=UPI003B20CE10